MQQVLAFEQSESAPLFEQVVQALRPLGSSPVGERVPVETPVLPVVVLALMMAWVAQSLRETWILAVGGFISV